MNKCNIAKTKNVIFVFKRFFRVFFVRQIQIHDALDDLGKNACCRSKFLAIFQMLIPLY